MYNKEKVIKGLEHCKFGDPGPCYEKDCPYYQSIECTDELKNDILVLLKEQDNCENCAIAIEDRQPVVRCKDCKHGEESIKPYKDYWCHLHDFYQYGNWFCADGERKEG